METQAEYHKKALESIQKLMPKMKEALGMLYTVMWVLFVRILFL